MPSAEFAKVIEVLQKMWTSDATDVASARARLAIAETLFERPSDVRYEPIEVGGVRAEWTIAPNADAERTLVYFPAVGAPRGVLT